MAFRLKPDWKTIQSPDGVNNVRQDICWLETIAVELVTILLVTMGIHSCSIIIHSNNMGTIGAANKGHSRHYHINLSICCTYSLLIPYLITHIFKYVPSESNLADPILRRDLGPPSLMIQHTFLLPVELIPFFDV